MPTALVIRRIYQTSVQAQTHSRDCPSRHPAMFFTLNLLYVSYNFFLQPLNTRSMTRSLFLINNQLLMFFPSEFLYWRFETKKKKSKRIANASIRERGYDLDYLACLTAEHQKSWKYRLFFFQYVPALGNLELPNGKRVQMTRLSNIISQRHISGKSDMVGVMAARNGMECLIYKSLLFWRHRIRVSMYNLAAWWRSYRGKQ